MKSNKWAWRKFCTINCGVLETQFLDGHLPYQLLWHQLNFRWNHIFKTWFQCLKSWRCYSSKKINKLALFLIIINKIILFFQKKKKPHFHLLHGLHFLLLLRASTLVKLEILAFNTVKSYFIYFNTQFHNTLCINSLIFFISQILFIFLLIFFSLPLCHETQLSDKFFFFMPSCYSELLVLAIHCSKKEKNIVFGIINVGH